MFKPGDKVRCVEPGITNLVRDRIYTVKSCRGVYTEVEELEDAHYSGRFELVQPTFDTALILRCLRILEADTNSQSVLAQVRDAIKQLEGGAATK